MLNFVYKFRNFMNNRYGTDELSKALFYLYILLIVINLFFKSNIIFYVELAILMIILLRYFSKNFSRREKENRIFLRIKNTILKPFKIIIKNIKDKNNVYKRCHKCKIILKLPLPSKTGVKRVRCPECNHKNRFLILKKQKIKIIRRWNQID